RFPGRCSSASTVRSGPRRSPGSDCGSGVVLASPLSVLRVLPETGERQLKEARQLLLTLHDALLRFGAAPADRTALDDSIRQLDDFFLLVVAGEFNSGKSAFINALIGQPILEEGVVPTTARIHLLKYGDSVRRQPSEDGFDVVTAPVDVLREIHIVDTPGTNAIIREHERLTTEFVPRSDLV